MLPAVKQHSRYDNIRVGHVQKSNNNQHLNKLRDNMRIIRHLPLFFVSLYVSKVMFTEAQLSDSFIILGLVGLSGFISYLSSKEQETHQLKLLRDEIKELKGELKEKTSTFDDLKTRVSSIQLASGMKNVNRQ